MSSNFLSLRLRGDLPSSDELRNMIGLEPTLNGRKGMPFPPRGRRTFEQDVWTLTLVKWEGDAADEHEMEKAAATLERAAPGLRTLDRTRCHAELYISSVREEEQGGLEFPARLLSAAGLGALELVISILVLPFDEGEEA